MRARRSATPLPVLALLAVALAAPMPALAQAVVDALEVNANAGVDPGSTLDVAVRGTPRGQARVVLIGSGVSVPLRETAPGVYSGTYTVARSDRIDVTQPIQATLRANGRMVVSNFDFPRSFQETRRDTAPPVAAVTAPTQRIEPARTEPVRPEPAPPPVVLEPLTVQVLSPAVGTVVDSDQVLVQGRTLPHATVRAQVYAVPLVTPGRSAVALPVTQQAVQADAQGNFSFGLGAQPVPAGARLELDVVASQGSRTTPVQRHLLYQQPR